MHLPYLLLFMLNLVRATPVALEDSSPNSLLDLKHERSVPVVNDPSFFGVGNGNTKTQRNHPRDDEGPPYRLEYVSWKVTFERRKGDAGDFTSHGWIIGFPRASEKWGVRPGTGNPWEFIAVPGEKTPDKIRTVRRGEIFYTTNAYFDTLMEGGAPVKTTDRKYTEFTEWDYTDVREGYEFTIIRTENDELAHKNSVARVNNGKKVFMPTSGYIRLTFVHDLTGEVNFSNGASDYNANITGKIVQRGEMWV